MTLSYNPLSDPFTEDLSKLESVTFQDIVIIAGKHRDYHANTNRGTKILETAGECNCYIEKFFQKHYFKIIDSISKLFSNNKIYEYSNKGAILYDWACGQGLVSWIFLNQLAERRLKFRIDEIVLIEPSEIALSRAEQLIKLIDKKVKITKIHKPIEDISKSELARDQDVLRIHYISNFVDMLKWNEIDYLSKLIMGSQGQNDYVLAAISPYNQNALDRFINSFPESSRLTISKRDCTKSNSCKDCPNDSKSCPQSIKNRHDPRIERIALITAKREAISLVEQAPEIFANEIEETDVACAAYVCDPVLRLIKNGVFRFPEHETKFKYRFGTTDSNIPELVQSIYNTLINQIVRGMPSYVPIGIEDMIHEVYPNLVLRSIENGTIIDRFAVSNEELLFHQEGVKSSIAFKDQDLQMILVDSLIRVAQVQYALLQFLKHNFNQSRVRFLLFETDHFYAHFSMSSLVEALNHLSTLVPEFSFPHIEYEVYCDIEQPSITSGNDLFGFLVNSCNSFDATSIGKEDVAVICGNMPKVLDKFDLLRSIVVEPTNEKEVSERFHSSELIHYSLSAHPDSYHHSVIGHALWYFLRTLFRKVDFWPQQQEIITEALELRSILGVLPTGAGKSLIYQFSALMQPGFCIVIEPIRSLIKDQYVELSDLQIDAIYINSDLEANEKVTRFKRFVDGKSLFLLMSPERMQMPATKIDLLYMSNESRFATYFVIDEAHCVSEWGHDFRPSYLSLAKNASDCFKPKFGKQLPLIALTATASLDVQHDVQKEMTIHGSEKPHIITDPINRQEINYNFMRSRTRHRDIMNLFNSLSNETSTMPISKENAALVFCSYKKGKTGLFGNDSDGFYNILDRMYGKNIGVGYFSGTDDDDNASVGEMNRFQDMYKRSEIGIMVATQAFGMGFNKPNIRYSFHVDLPKSIESFVQESGRIGRDRTESHSYLIYDDIDKDYKLLVMNSSHVSEKLAAILFKALMEFKSETNKLDIKKQIPGVDKCNPWPKEPEEAKLIYFNKKIKSDNSVKDSDHDEELTCRYDLARNKLLNGPGNPFPKELFEDVLRAINYTSLIYDALNPVGKRSLLDIINTHSPHVIHHSISKYKLRDCLKDNLDYQYHISKQVINSYYENILKQCEFVLYRMQLLGIISSYSNNYSSGEYVIEFSTPPVNEILDNYKAYLSKYRSSAFIERRIDTLKDELVTDDLYAGYSMVFNDLSRFFDDNILKKRNQALQEMYQTAELGQKKSKDEIRDILDRYFNSKFMGDLSSDTDEGKEEKLEVIAKYIQEAANPARGSRIENLEHLEGACSRLLQEYPDNYVLLVLRSLTQLCLSNGNADLLRSGIDYLKKGFTLIFRENPQEAPEYIYDHVIELYLNSIKQDLYEADFHACQGVIFSLYADNTLKKHNEFLKLYGGSGGEL